MMESFRLCWQTMPGGRTECDAPTSQEVALLRLREQVTVFPDIRSWVVEETVPDRPFMTAECGE